MAIIVCCYGDTHAKPAAEVVREPNQRLLRAVHTFLLKWNSRHGGTIRTHTLDAAKTTGFSPVSQRLSESWFIRKLARYKGRNGNSSHNNGRPLTILLR